MKAEWKKAILEKVATALDIQESIVKLLGRTPGIRLLNSGIVQIECCDMKPEQIHELSKNLALRFDKTVSNCGFLKYTAIKDSVRIYVNTKRCFYGGDAIVESRSRTTARCPIPKEPIS